MQANRRCSDGPGEAQRAIVHQDSGEKSAAIVAADITALDISAAALSCLLDAGIESVQQLITHPVDDLLELPHLGAAEVCEIASRLHDRDLLLPPCHECRPIASYIYMNRNLEILRLRLVDGLPFAEIGPQVHLERERVRQVLRGNYGLRSIPGAVRARRLRNRRGA
jgi:Bacterial RNA polymerase, alpha chain C terminal domain